MYMIKITAYLIEVCSEFDRACILEETSKVKVDLMVGLAYIYIHTDETQLKKHNIYI